jgi:hypothetical protein
MAPETSALTTATEEFVRRSRGSREGSGYDYGRDRADAASRDRSLFPTGLSFRLSFRIGRTPLIKRGSCFWRAQAMCGAAERRGGASARWPARPDLGWRRPSRLVTTENRLNTSLDELGRLKPSTMFAAFGAEPTLRWRWICRGQPGGCSTCRHLGPPDEFLV